ARGDVRRVRPGRPGREGADARRPGRRRLLCARRGRWQGRRRRRTRQGAPGVGRCDRGSGPYALAMTSSDEYAIGASDLLRWAETLSGIARTGLGFTQSLYERERFEEVLHVASDIRAAAIEEAESDALFEEWLSTVGEGVAGYVTPKVAIAAIVGNDEGEILLTQRA